MDYSAVTHARESAGSNTYHMQEIRSVRLRTFVTTH